MRIFRFSGAFGGINCSSYSRPISGFAVQRAVWRVKRPDWQFAQRWQGRMSAASPRCAFFGRSGSASIWRPSATMSALPEAIASSIIAGSLKPPTVVTGTCTTRLTAAARWSRCPRGSKIGDCMMS